MTTVINTNISSQIAQNYLQNNQAAVTNAITQLSSGLSINSAADNPAGMAISTTLQAQINGQTVAQANANTGISLAQTGQSALTQITNNLQTIRQLAVQASNASYSAANRASLNQEVQQSLAQINTIASTTAFNGQNLLDGSFGTKNFQIGANVGQTIGVNLSQSVQTAQIGQTSNTTFSVAGLANGGLSTESLSVSVGGAPAITVGTSSAGTAAGQTADSAYAAAAAISNSNVAGLTASANNAQKFTYTGVNNDPTAVSAATYNLTINGTNVFGQSGLSVGVGNTVSASTVLTAINSQSSNTGVTATLADDGKTFTLSAADGRNIIVSQGTNGAKVLGGLDNTTQKINNVGGTLTALTVGAITSASSGQLYGSVTLSSSDSITLSGNAANNIAATYDNATNSADSLQASQTLTATKAFTPVANGTTAFYLNGSATATATITASATDTAASFAQKINGSIALQQAGITANVNSTGKLVVTNSSGQNLAAIDSTAGFTSGLDNAQQFTAGAFTAGTTGTTAVTFKLGGNAVDTLSFSGATSIATVQSAINNDATLKAAGLSADIAGGKLVITNTSGQTFSATEAASGGGDLVTGLATGAVSGGTFEQTTDNTRYSAATSGSLAGIDVLTAADAQKAIQTVDAALNQVNTLQGQLGAVQNRFSSVISNLSASEQNAQSTQSAIQDTNYASASSALSRAQVLSQAATAMVAQANQLPQQVLKLLQ